MKNSSLNRYHILASFLQEKPYAFTLSADKSRAIENREFFERQLVNSATYAGNFGFKNDFAPIGLSYANSTKTIDRASRPSQEYRDDEIYFELNNESELTGETRLDFNQNKFSRTESGTSDQKGISRDYTLLNQKHISGDGKKTLDTYLHYFGLSNTSIATNKNSIFTLSEKLGIEHNDSLISTYDYNFSDKSSAGTETKDNRVSAGLSHKLYESLTSSFNSYYFNSDSNTFSQESYGTSLNEDYVKMLGKIMKLSFGARVGYSEERRKAPGNTISVIDESHILTTGTITFLDKPRVDATTVVVTNQTGTTTYTINIDYQLSSAGERTQIQRIPGGSISNSGTILADYQAQSSPYFKFNTFSENYSPRIDFFNGLIGVFYRLVKERHPVVSGEENATIQTLVDRVFGLDFHYNNLMIEFENEDYDSNLSPYRRIILKESLLINPSQTSTITLQSSQSEVRLVDVQNTQRYFDFLSRYSIGLGRYSRFNTEAGFRWQNGTGVDLNDFSAGSSYELNLGKFLMNLKYDFKRQLYLGDKLSNHFFYTKIKRRF